MAVNIKLNYLYRDYSNFKQYGSVVFENRNDIAIEELTAIIETHLIDGEYFSVDQWNIPNLFFETRTEDDHGWHEFQNLELVEEDADYGDIKNFLARI